MSRARPGAEPTLLALLDRAEGGAYERVGAEAGPLSGVGRRALGTVACLP